MEAMVDGAVIKIESKILVEDIFSQQKVPFHFYTRYFNWAFKPEILSRVLNRLFSLLEKRSSLTDRQFKGS